MSNVGYLLARLPRLYPDTPARPMGARRFLALLGDRNLQHVCASVLDWLATANWEAQSLHLPLPFADAGVATAGGQAPMAVWRNYYQRLARLDTPVLVRRWAAEDRAMITRRATDRGGSIELKARGAIANELAQSAGTRKLTAALQEDRQTLATVFARIDQHLYGCDNFADDHIYAYAIRLLMLARIGVPEEVSHAA